MFFSKSPAGDILIISLIFMDKSSKKAKFFMRLSQYLA
jgi:hypothetical protein